MLVLLKKDLLISTKGLRVAQIDVSIRKSGKAILRLQYEDDKIIPIVCSIEEGEQFLQKILSANSQ